MAIAIPVAVAAVATGGILGTAGSITGAAIAIRQRFKRREGTDVIKTFDEFVEHLKEASHFMFIRGK